MRTEPIEIFPRFVLGERVVYYYEVRNTRHGDSGTTTRGALITTVRNICIERTIDEVKIYYQLNFGGIGDQDSFIHEDKLNNYDDIKL
jgi:hypothetical protein